MSELAIIIPAYKIDFFDQALESLARQTCSDFKVYIGDDCSPSNLREVAERYKDVLQISYTRFDKNIGSKNIVRQWERSVALSTAEKWIWLFSDDDIADATCVENFYKITSRNGERFDLYRFDTIVIDEKGKVIRKLAEGVAEESSEELAYLLLKDQRQIAMQDHIFSREIYNQMGGFVFTYFAQGADWATSILFSSRKGIAVIPESKFYWRLSNSNITGSDSRQKSKMLAGHLQFTAWVMKHFKYLESSPSSITYPMITEAARFNLLNVIIYHFKGLTIGNLIEIVPFMRKVLHMSTGQILNDLNSVLISTTLFGRWYVQLSNYSKRRILALFYDKHSK